MMMNLFSIFDPSTSSTLSLNWMSMILLLVMLPLPFWFTKNRITFTKNKIMANLHYELSLILFKAPQSLMFLLATLIFILMNNLSGLLPNVFTSTSHMSVSMAMSMPMWLGLFMMSWIFNTKKMLMHLIPTDTPFFLMPMMVLIETLSSLIQPFTLAIRLMANMTAGHLILSILMEASSKVSFTQTPVIMLTQVIISLLELAVAMIQAYVFTILMTIYTSNSMI